MKAIAHFLNPNPLLPWFRVPIAFYCILSKKLNPGMIMRRGVLLFILFLALSNCFSQFYFSGKIVDEKSVVVPGATVSLLT